MGGPRGTEWIGPDGVALLSDRPAAVYNGIGYFGFDREIFSMQYRLIVFSFLLALAAGCGPELSPSDLGEVVTELPKVAGVDEPYPMPQLGPPSTAEDKEGERANLTHP
jgi:hypothetical protein